MEQILEMDSKPKCDWNIGKAFNALMSITSTIFA